jgi:hypothetical protein
MYLDPSFGGMFLQIIVAIIAGGGAILFGMRRKIKAAFNKGKTGSAAAVNASPPSTDDVIDMMADKDKDRDS